MEDSDIIVHRWSLNSLMLLPHVDKAQSILDSPESTHFRSPDAHNVNAIMDHLCLNYSPACLAAINAPDSFINDIDLEALFVGINGRTPDAEVSSKSSKENIGYIGLP